MQDQPEHISVNHCTLVARGGARAGRLTAGQGGSGSYAPAVTGLTQAPSGRVLTGMDASVEQVASLLTSGSEPPQVVAIVGPPGQGLPLFHGSFVAVAEVVASGELMLPFGHL